MLQAVISESTHNSKRATSRTPVPLFICSTTFVAYDLLLQTV